MDPENRELADTNWTHENAARLLAILTPMAYEPKKLIAPVAYRLEAMLLPQLRDSAATIYRFQRARAGGELLRAYEIVIDCFVRNNLPEAREKILAARRSCEEFAAAGARSLAFLEGITDPFGHVLHRQQTVGFQQLTERQKFVSRVLELKLGDLFELFSGVLESVKWSELGEDADFQEVQQKALTEYFALTCRALREIGASQTALAVERTCHGGSWQDLEEQLRVGEDLEAMLYDYVRRFPDEFRDAQP